MTDFSVNEKKFFIANGKSFKKFINEIENSKNNQSSSTDYANEIIRNEIGEIRKLIDKNNGWNKLINK